MEHNATHITPGAFDADRVQIDWWQAGVVWQEGDDGRVTYCAVWDADRFAEEFGSVNPHDMRAVAAAIEEHDVPTLVLDQSMAIWEQDHADRAAEWHAEQAFDGRTV